MNIDEYKAKSGRIIKEDNNTINLADILYKDIEQGSGFFTTISPEHRNYEEGGAFMVTHILPSLAIGASTYLHIHTHDEDTTAIKGILLVSDRAIKVEFFEEPTLTAGTTEIIVSQRDRRQTTKLICNTKYYSDPSNITDEGTLIEHIILGGATSTQGNNPLGMGGNQSGDMTGYNLKLDTDYLLKLTNISDDATGALTIKQNIYMVTRTPPV